MLDGSDHLPLADKVQMSVLSLLDCGVIGEEFGEISGVPPVELLRVHFNFRLSDCLAINGLEVMQKGFPILLIGEFGDFVSGEVVVGVFELHLASDFCGFGVLNQRILLFFGTQNQLLLGGRGVVVGNLLINCKL